MRWRIHALAVAAAQTPGMRRRDLVFLTACSLAGAVPMSDPSVPDHLQRSLSNRHLQLIAIGGAIGTGLFMGSGKTINE